MNQHKMSTVATIGFVIGVGLWVNPVLGQKIYWIEYRPNGGGPNEIKRANLDGSNAETVVEAELTSPYNIALDLGAGKMYWAEPSSARIQRANLDGLNVETLLATAHQPGGVALDVGGGKIYWVDTSGGKIMRANLDGSDAEVLVTGLDSPSGDIALDLPSGKMYWTEDTPRIRRANLDGSGAETLLLYPAGESAHALALDLVNGKMYWSNTNSSYEESAIHRANLDGSDEEWVPFGPHPNYAVEHIALDPALGKIYWTGWDTGGWGVHSAYVHLTFQLPVILIPDASGLALDAAAGKVYVTNLAKIQRADLNPDWPNVVTVLENRNGLVNPWALALDSVNRRLYWADGNVNSLCGLNLEGEPLVECVPYGVNGVAVDSLFPGHIFYSSRGLPFSGIFHMTFPFASSAQQVSTAGAYSLGGVALDVSAGKVYWSGKDSAGAPYKIYRADVSGGQLEILVDTGSSVPDIALDVPAGKIYWGRFRANLDGSDVESISTSVNVHGIGLDLFSGKKYWTTGLGAIRRSNLDGSQSEDVFLSAIAGAKLRGMALDVNCERRLYGDVDPELGNNAVDVDDILLVLAGFIDPMGYPAADLYPCPPNGDGIIDVDDIAGILAAFVGNASCPHLCR